jgi:ketosteroid isomerase-like protein
MILMARTLLLTFLFLSTVAVHSQTKTVEETQAAESEIRATREASNQALMHHDIQAFAASLDQDFVMVRGNGVLVPSRQAYLDPFAKDFANPNSVRYQRLPITVEISSAAPLAAERGDWSALRPDGSRAYGGRYMAMWRKTTAGWKLRSELLWFCFVTTQPSARAIPSHREFSTY